MRRSRRPGMEYGSGVQGQCLRGCGTAAAAGTRGERSPRPGPGAPASRCMPVGARGRMRRQNTSCRGAVTAEFAVALPAVLLLLVLLLAASAAGVTQLRLEEAARAGARALARGEDGSTVDGIVRRFAGATATSTVDSDGGWLAVTVSAKVAGAAGSLIPWTLTARAWAWKELADSPAVAVPQSVFGDLGRPS